AAQSSNEAPRRMRSMIFALRAVACDEDLWLPSGRVPRGCLFLLGLVLIQHHSSRLAAVLAAASWRTTAGPPGSYPKRLNGFRCARKGLRSFQLRARFFPTIQFSPQIAPHHHGVQPDGCG